MHVTTTFEIEGFRIEEYKGLVRGIVGGLKNIVGGRIGAYTNMCEQARDQAYREMLKHAEEFGANAIVGIRYDASEVITQSTEVLCYGTAVIVEPHPPAAV